MNADQQAGNSHPDQNGLETFSAAASVLISAALVVALHAALSGSLIRAKPAGLAEAAPLEQIVASADQPRTQMLR